MTSTELRDATRLLSELVSIPSVNPGRSSGNNVAPYGEERLQRMLDRMLHNWGARTSMPEMIPGRYNFMARFRGVDSTRSLMLEAHADTVAAEHMTIAPFDPVVENGRLYGRGSCDTKGPMAAMLLGLKSVLDQDERPPVDVYFVSTCNEEAGAAGAHHLMTDEELRPQAAIVGEPTDMKIVNEHKGVVRWRIRTHGVAAHSSAPRNGVNAIAHMARIVERIEGPLADALAQRAHPRLGAPTTMVGIIRGGSAVNIVPGLCEIEVDRRLIPGESREAAGRELKEMLDPLARSDAQLRYDIEEIEWYPPLDEPLDSPLSRALAASCQRVMGKAEFAAVPWGANSGIFRHHGVPSVCFGPGSIRQAHTTDEYIELDQVVLASRVYADMIRNFGREA